MPRARAAAVVAVIAVARRLCGPRARRRGRRPQDAQHSLRAPVTDETFYFVMADRFENGDTANDLGGLTPRPRRSPASTRPHAASTTAAT